jgi:hypothetical protein
LNKARTREEEAINKAIDLGVAVADQALVEAARLVLATALVACEYCEEKFIVCCGEA